MPSFNLLNPSAVAPSGPFSHGLLIPAGHDIIITAGQIGTSDPEGTIPDSYEAQVDAAVKNLGLVLAEAGAGPSDIIKLTYYIVDYGESFWTSKHYCYLTSNRVVDVSIRPVHIMPSPSFSTVIDQAPL
jgi:enamine deaminase RidA (YjgF/YER057c/UK114 family)